MNLVNRQREVGLAQASATNPFASPAEIMLAATEELGEVAQEVALFEKVGSKAGWTKEASAERLAKEISDTINCLCALANHYHIDIDATRQ